MTKAVAAKSFDWDTTFDFGKHKGKTVKELFSNIDGISYLAWYRDQHLTGTGLTQVFTDRVEERLVEKIQGDSYLRKKFGKRKPAAPLDFSKEPANVERIEERRAVAYAGAWGEF